MKIQRWFHPSSTPLTRAITVHFVGSVSISEVEVAQVAGNAAAEEALASRRVQQLLSTFAHKAATPEGQTVLHAHVLQMIRGEQDEIPDEVPE